MEVSAKGAGEEPLLKGVFPGPSGREESIFLLCASAGETQRSCNIRLHQAAYATLRPLESGTFTGWEIVDNTARLCAMNLEAALEQFAGIAESPGETEQVVREHA